MKIINLYQADIAGCLPQLYTELVITKKKHKLTVLQRAWDDTATALGVHVPTMVSPVLLQISIVLTIRLEDKYDLYTGLHPFMLDQHMATVRKLLPISGEYCNLVAGGTGTTVVEAENMRVPDGVVLPSTLSMDREILTYT